jgi:hypothetical protein
MKRMKDRKNKNKRKRVERLLGELRIPVRLQTTV